MFSRTNPSPSHEVATWPSRSARALALSTCTLAMLVCAPVRAQKYDPGASDTEVRVGSTSAITGQFSEYGAEGRAEAAYFRMINDRGGINGRKINFIVRDDGSNPRQALRLAQQLVEQDQVLLLFGTWGHAANLAIRTYANEKKVPQLFVQSSSSDFADPAHYPWTMGFLASFRTEASAYAKYILSNMPNAKIGVLYANDDTDLEYLAGLREGLGSHAQSMIVLESEFAYADPSSVDMQLEALKASGADVFVNLAIGRSATQAIRKAYEIGWHPTQFIPNATLSVAAFLEPAGLAKATGIISNARSKGWMTGGARADPAVADFVTWMAKYNPEANIRDQLNVSGYERAQTLVEVLRRCGNDLTRENVMKQAASLDLELGILRPGIRITTGPNDYQPIKQLFLIRFNGRDWATLGAVVGG